MTVEVIVPYRAGCEHRERALAYVTSRYEHPVTIAHAPAGPWSKGATVNPAVRASRADILVIADADVWTTGTDAAVDAIAAGASWALPHGSVRRLSQPATQLVLDGHPLTDQLELAERAYRGIHAGGILVARRSTLLQIPLDPRFNGWGGEDQAWGYALYTLLGGAWEGHPPLWHLWHPPQERLNRRVGSVASDQLRRRYLKARRDPAVMHALLAEHREDP